MIPSLWRHLVREILWSVITILEMLRFMETNLLNHTGEYLYWFWKLSLVNYLFFFSSFLLWRGRLVDHKLISKASPVGQNIYMGELGSCSCIYMIYIMYIHSFILWYLLYSQEVIGSPTLTNWLSVFHFLSTLTRPNWCQADIVFGEYLGPCKWFSSAGIH